MESAESWVEGLDRHYLLIDHQDDSMFRPLARGRVELIHKEALLPKGYRPLFGSRRWWWNFRGLPVRGWIVQQVTKLAVTEICDAAAFVYADSDLVFVRPWDVQTLWKGEDVRLFRDERRGEMLDSKRYKNWYNQAARYCGIANQKELTGSYIAQLNSLRRDRLIELQKRVSAVSGRPWKDALLQTLDVSEFVLYGAFAELACKLSGHYIDDQPLVHSSWYHNIATEADLQAFIGQLAPHHVGVHVQSNLHIPPSVYKSLVERKQ